MEIVDKHINIYMTFDEFCNNIVVKESLLAKRESKNDYNRYLEDNGWNMCGEGAYGAVFEKPGKKYVLKVFNDQGYNVFLDFIEQNAENPHLAKIQRKIIKSDPGSFLGVVAIEKLKPIDQTKYGWIYEILDSFGTFINRYIRLHNQESFEIVLEQFYKYFINKSKPNYSQMLKNGHKLNSYERAQYNINKKSMDRLDFFVENYLPVARTLFELSMYVMQKHMDSNSRYFDLHLGNFMIRPSTNEIVITDPLI